MKQFTSFLVLLFLQLTIYCQPNFQGVLTHSDSIKKTDSLCVEIRSLLYEARGPIITSPLSIIYDTLSSDTLFIDLLFDITGPTTNSRFHIDTFKVIRNWSLKDYTLVCFWNLISYHGRNPPVMSYNLRRYFSDTVQFFVDNSTQLENISKEQNGYIVYPNPTKEFIQINGIQDINSEIFILNLQGREVFRKPFKKRLNVSSLENGIYFLNISNENGISSQKFVKY